MTGDRKYLARWNKYLPVIRLHLKKAIAEDQRIVLDEVDFKTVGNRTASGYTFNLEVANGKVTNDISGTVVAVTLFEVLKDDAVCRSILNTRRTKISLGKNYTLQIRVLMPE